MALLAEIEEAAKTGPDDLGKAVLSAHAAVKEATEWMLAAPDINDRFAGAAPYLRAWALLLGGHYHLKAAGDAARLPLAAFHIRQIMAEIPGLLTAATEGAAPLYALDAEALAG